MKKAFFIIIIILLIAIISLGGYLLVNKNDQNIIENTSNIETSTQLEETVEEPKIETEKEDDNMKDIVIKVNGYDLIVKLEDNSSAKALLEKLNNGSITINATDYGNFEKVGDLGFSLPTNDENITTTPGDVILYQGNKITIYYDTNNWTFTRLGKIQNIENINLKDILGSGDVTFVMSIND